MTESRLTVMADDAPFQALPKASGRNALFTTSIVCTHLVALLAFVPWFFSWTGVILAVLGLYVFGTLGISLGYHRLLSHRTYQCPKWLERVLIVLGVGAAQGSPGFWVATHRNHHRFADEPPDLHTPRRSFLSAHMGWLFSAPTDRVLADLTDTYPSELARDPFIAWLNRDHQWLWIDLGFLILFFGGGYAAGLAGGSAHADALQFGCSLLVWGYAVRTVAVWHITWSVNSLTHMYGYRNFDCEDDSRNNYLIGYLSFGEGWHNNHHAEPQSANFGRHWWEFDFSYNTIQILEFLGLAWNVSRPKRYPE